MRSEQPNIVLTLADDWGWSDIVPYGGEVKTHLNRLALQDLVAAVLSKRDPFIEMTRRY